MEVDRRKNRKLVHGKTGSWPTEKKLEVEAQFYGRKLASSLRVVVVFSADGCLLNGYGTYLKPPEIMTLCVYPYSTLKLESGSHYKNVKNLNFKPRMQKSYDFKPNSWNHFKTFPMTSSLYFRSQRVILGSTLEEQNLFLFQIRGG